MTRKSEEVVLHLEAHPKAVKRALRAKPEPGNEAAEFDVVDVRRSVAADGEHGNTTVVLKHKYDAATLKVFQARLVKRANRENEALFNDDDEVAE